MANTKISALTSLGADPVSGDYFVIVDVSDTTMAASGTTKKLDAGRIPYLSSAVNTFTGSIVGARIRSGVTGSMGDNTIATITVPVSRGLIVFGPNNTGGTNNASGIIAFDTVGGSSSSIAVGTSVETSTGIPTGTTGTDGKFTFFVHTNGNIYFENRLGYGVNIAFLFL